MRKWKMWLGNLSISFRFYEKFKADDTYLFFLNSN